MTTKRSCFFRIEYGSRSSQFLILHPKEHKEKIKNRLEREPYSILKKQDRFVVINYDEVINVYNKQVELEKIKFY